MINNTINFMWIGKELTEIGILSLSSANALGYACTLWMYEEVINVPDFVIQKDATEITAFRSGKTELFSDYFRYKLLWSQGGVWSDLDNIFIKKLPSVTYILSGIIKDSANSHLMKTPKGCSMLGSIISEIEQDFVFSYPKTFNGIYLIDKIQEFGLTTHLLEPYTLNFFNNDMIRLCMEDLTVSDLSDCYCIHLFESQHRAAYKHNEMYMKNLNFLKLMLQQ
jgi:hypothetical protein